MTEDVLPPNASALERAIASLSQKIESIPVPLATLYDATLCPAALLPWLAWAFSVDMWHDGWSEATKRRLIANSLIIHRKKGTRASLMHALQLLGVSAEIKEWWQEIPRQSPHTFTVSLDTLITRQQRALSPTLYQQLETLLEQTKPARSHYQLLIKTQLHTTLQFGLAVRLRQFCNAGAILKRQWPEIKTGLHIALKIQPLSRLR